MIHNKKASPISNRQGLLLQRFSDYAAEDKLLLSIFLP
jgi:hypothetical protein